MGFTSYIYPSARHSRFEHSLGVAIVAGKMFSYPSLNTDIYFIDDNDKTSIRLSALLHDVGHCLYSHTSELVYGMWLYDLIKEEFGKQTVDPSPHEFLSYLIIKSSAFREYFDKLSKLYKLELDLDEIAHRIVCRVSTESKRYITSFINGPFDADKIDYFYRDSQFSGIPIQLDLDRLFYEITISDISELIENIDKVCDLTVGVKGVTCIEQIIFNKMILYATVYNHHKVQAMDCMFKGVFEYINEKNIGININGHLKQIDSPVDFLYMVDYNLFSMMNETDDPKLRELIRNIQNRRLLKRALLINHNTVETGDLLQLLSTDVNRAEQEEFLRSIANKIYSHAHVDCDPSEVWIDIPKAPSFKEASMPFIRTNQDKTKTEFSPVSNYYPYSQFSDLYKIHKLNCHVFAPENYVVEISKSAREVFKSELDIEFNDESISYIR
jgi:HD superfamily phosphohydrolase